MRRRIRPPRFRGPGVGRGPRDRRGGEIVDLELGVGLVLGEDVPRDHEDGVGDGKNPLGLAPAAEAAPEALVLRAQVGAARTVVARRPPPSPCAAPCRPYGRVRRDVLRLTRGCPGTAGPRTPDAPRSGSGASP